MSDIRLDGRVALITGAGQGLGRAHALELARRGARVVVNDLAPAPGSRDGAAEVVAELVAAGHTAVLAHGSVTDPAAMQQAVDAARSQWGSLDVVVANAGIVRDRTVAKMTLEEFQSVVDVNLVGSFIPVKAAWAAMREQGYGRVVLTTSSSGLYGNFGQANYSAAKMGLLGLMNTLNLEGAKYGIRVNVLAPGAATPMTDGSMAPHLVDRMSPARVSPAVAFLASEEAPQGVVLSAVAGGFASARVVENVGVFLGEETSAELIRDRWSEITAPEGERTYGHAAASGERFFDREDA